MKPRSFWYNEEEMVFQETGSKNRHHMSADGFSLIELLVVMGVTVILSTIMIAYNSTSRQQIAYSVERVKLAQVINRAKARTMNAFEPLIDTCGYGVRFTYTSPQKYELVRYDAISTSTPCTFSNFQVKADGVVESYLLPTGLSIGAVAGNSNLIGQLAFVPPDPKTYLVDGSGNTLLPSGYVNLSAAGGSVSGTITVSTAGLITY